MPEVITLDMTTPAPAQEAPAKSPLDAILEAHAIGQAPEDEAEEQDEAQEAVDDDKQLKSLLRKAESAFCKVKKAEVVFRVECGKWCHAIYLLRQEQGYKDRGFTSQIIFNTLAIHADSKRECDASELAHIYKCVELLCPPDQWKAMAKLPKHPLTIGKLLLLKKLVQPVDGTELYGVFDNAKEEQAKALFAWAWATGSRSHRARTSRPACWN